MGEEVFQGMRFKRTPAEIMAAAVIRSIVLPIHGIGLKRYKKALGDARAVQRQALFKKLHHCADTRYGRDHDFAAIKTIEDFRRNVPINQYEDLAPYIKDVAAGDTGALFPKSEDVLAFACTTGTTGEPKLNPVTRSWLKEYRGGWDVWGSKAISEHPGTLGLKTLQISGPSELDRSPSGLPIGMASSVTARFQSAILKSFYAAPMEVSDIADPLARYYLTLRLAMTQRVGFIVTLTPANLIRLAQIGNDEAQGLIRDIHDGTLGRDLEISGTMRELVAAKLKVKHVVRSRELEAVLQRTGTLYPKDYWPLALMACWIGGTVGYRARDLRTYYGDVPKRDLGLASTEGRHTIPFDDERAEGVLAVEGSYYEFIPVENYGRDNPTVLEGADLKIGAEYNILVTTSSGLYRYDLGDVVRCTGFIGEAPVLAFLHKAGDTCDMEGEKVSAYQITTAVGGAFEELGTRSALVTAAAVRPNHDAPYYALLIEADRLADEGQARQFLKSVDASLIAQNVMYAGKRNDNYIGPPRLMRLAPGSWSDYSASLMAKRGTGDTQYKHAALITQPGWVDQFDVNDVIELNKAGHVARTG